jgi:hypothetical protein
MEAPYSNSLLAPSMNMFTVSLLVVELFCLAWTVGYEVSSKRGATPVLSQLSMLGTFAAPIAKAILVYGANYSRDWRKCAGFAFRQVSRYPTEYIHDAVPSIRR